MLRAEVIIDWRFFRFARICEMRSKHLVSAAFPVQVMCMTDTPDIINARMSRFVRKLIAPVAIATVISLGAVLSLIWIAARGQDQVAAESSAGLMQAVLAGQERDLGQLVYDYTWWDAAIENLIDRPNREWADETIGLHAAETFGVSETFVVADTNWTMFAYRDGVPSRDDAFAYFGVALEHVIAAARNTPMLEPAPVTAYLTRQGSVHLVAVSALTPENPTAAQMEYRPRPVLVHARELSPEFLRGISAQFGFDDLSLTDERPAADGQMLTFALQGSQGNGAGWLRWSPPYPGSALFADILPWLFAGVMVLFVLAVVFLRRVMRAARHMALDAEALASKDRQLAQTSKLAVLGEMAAGVVHELNQPLNIIRMATDSTQAALQRSKVSEDYESLREQLTVIDGQTRRMAETIQSMRIFSRDDYGRKIAFDVVRATTEALNWMRPELATNGVAVSFRAPAQCGRVYGEPARYEQVIVNLLLNARDAVLDHLKNGAAESCQVRIEIKEDLSADRILVVVSDNGGGVPDEHIERLFEPFYTTKGPGEGTGLGLSISYGIVTGMDGELSARNGGAGAEFTISIPRVVPKDVADDAAPMENGSR